MKIIARILVSIALIFPTASLFAQEQEPQKTPVEMAAEQANKFQTEFKLTDAQTFLVDSVLQVNLAGVYDEFEMMKRGGVQSNESYKAVQDKWFKKTEDAFRLILNADQFLQYQKMTGSYAKNKKAEKEKAKLEAKLKAKLAKSK